jgi:hypothetical protein
MLPAYLATPDDFARFLDAVHRGQWPRSDWNHAAHLSAAAAEVCAGDPSTAIDRVRRLILAYNQSQGIVSTPDAGYHETVTRFWVDRLRELVPALGRDATPFEAARAAVAAFAHRRGMLQCYYTFDVLNHRAARASYIPPDREHVTLRA